MCCFNQYYRALRGFEVPRQNQYSPYVCARGLNFLSPGATWLSLRSKVQQRLKSGQATVRSNFLAAFSGARKRDMVKAS